MDRFLQFLIGIFSFKKKNKFPSLREGLGRGLFVLCTLYSVLSTAQTFPVQVIPQALPPAPIYISNYADASTVTSPLRVQIILNDFEIANREIRLKTYFTGSGLSFQSNDLVVGASPLFLEGGIPLILTNAELAPYFEFNNITGINANQYGSAIPEGAYQFCVEVYDVLTGSRLSNKNCAVSVVFQNEPPFLVLPRNKENVDEINPQYIVFQWTPRSINVSNVEYELSMVEIWDNQVDPQQAFLSSPPVFQTTTTATTYVYGPSDPLLLSGKKYAWRVQAKAKQGTEEIGLFKNEGYSEIYSFSYAASCELPAAVNHEVKGSTNANIFWDDFSTEIPEYTVRYRQKNVQDAEWFLAKTTGNELTIWELKAGTTYEYQLSKNCGVAQSDWSFTKEFTTALEFEEESVLDCGVSPDINLTNMEPLASIATGETFVAGDFPVKILEVSGSNGKFTGKGYVSLPYLENIKVAVEFTNILINTDRDMAEGSVITVYDPDWKNILDVDVVIDVADDILDEFTGGDQNVPIKVDFEVPSTDNIKIENGKIVITGPNGETTTNDYDEGDSYVITDSKGNTFNIDKDGNITEGDKGAPGGEATADNTSGISGGSGTAADPSVQQITATDITVTFDASTSTYGFDEATSDFEKANYPKVSLPNGGDYYPVHKAVVAGKSDNLIANVQTTNPDIQLDSLIFKTVKGTLIPTTRNNNSFTLTLNGNNSYHSDEAIVTYKAKDGKYKIAASFFIHHIKQHDKVDVVIVQVNNADALSNIDQKLDPLFKTAGASFNIIRKQLSVTTEQWDTKTANNSLDYDGSGIASNYPDEFKNITQAYKDDNPNWNRRAYHLFVLPEDIPNTKGINGFMPKGRQWGYVFEAHKGSGIENKATLNLTAMHELGHGIFGLPHPFENDEDTSGEGTDWLMDYGGGEQLSYSNWAHMSDEGLKLYLFQTDEDGEYSNSEYFEKLLQQIRCAYASGINSIEMPEKYITGYNKQVITFNYGLPIRRSDINGEKITSGWFTSTSGAATITNIRNAIIDPNKGDIIFGNFKIDVPVPVYTFNNNITPFEHLIDYLFPTSADIEKDFNTIWNDNIKQKVESNQMLSSDDINNLKKIASCGTELLSSDTKYKLLKSLLKVGWTNWWIDEEQEDLILDIIATTPPGNKSKELFDKINADNALLEDLMGSLDDTSGNENNFVRLGKEIFSLFDRAYSDAARNSLYNNLDAGKKLYFYGANSPEMCTWRISASKGSNKFNFDETHVFNIQYGDYNPLIAGSSLPTCQTENKKYSFSYSDFIAVKFIGDQSTYDFDDGLNLMPASVYYILLKSNSNQIIRTQLETFVFVLGILTPIDEFYLLGKAIQYGNRGIKALRYSSIKSLSQVNKIKVPLDTSGKKLEELSNGKVDKFVEFVDDGAGLSDELLTAIRLGKRNDGTLAKALDDAGFPKSADAVRKSSNVQSNNTKGLDLGDAQIPNAIEDYTFNVDGITFSKNSSENWKEFFDRISASGKLNAFESHHIFPVDLLKRESFRKWYELIGHQKIDLNGVSTLENLIMLEKKLLANQRGVHSNHPKYTDEIGVYFDEQWAKYKADNTSWDDSRIAAEVDKDARHLANEIKKSLLENSVKENTEIVSFWDVIDFDDLIR
ncbi:hypothetical protein [Maribacter sp. 2308TA10-17]|uniref:hypothetical protein n=1 Tax=Maribacter sp. 2308TA10-17 TaxID=3386276 RepID=UPI0039BD2A63